MMSHASMYLTSGNHSEARLVHKVRALVGWESTGLRVELLVGKQGTARHFEEPSLKQRMMALVTRLCAEPARVSESGFCSDFHHSVGRRFERLEIRGQHRHHLSR